MSLAPLNAAESRTLAKIAKAGTEGALVSTLDLRHLGRLDRRGLIVSVDRSNTCEVGARVRLAA